ncbi:hypothetical protein KZZ08_00540 [Roseovarius mucosus]|uniref:phage capsid protein n=1 Tax=Roseovarius mucosus TaxID=215743 RepID=UPI001C5F8D8F|nr:phage capsid protein [Roseovarius mucosus]MBW4972083.1 hypothetical protein [Roseovarius mucosus]
MSYRQVVEDHHKTTYTNNVMMVAQQVANPLRAAVTVASASGEAQNVADLIDKSEYSEGEDYSRENPDNPPNRRRRWLVRPTVIEHGQYITKEEKFDQAMDPSSQLMRNSVLTVERGVYDKILGVKKVGNVYKAVRAGIMGKAIEGKGPNSTMNFPAPNYIAVDQGISGTPHGLSVAKLRAATEAMELEDFGLETDMSIYGLITPKQKTDLINLAVETKTSLNPFEIENIRAGKPGMLLGINWLFSNRVPVDDSGYRLIPIWSKENVVMGVWQDVQGQMWNDTARKNLPYMYNDVYVDATRIEDGGVRIIRCAE